MVSWFQIDDVTVNVFRKNIKNVHLSVHPPNGRVRVSAPVRMDMNTLRAFVSSKLEWIRRQQEKVRQQARAREIPREYSERETHFVWGKPYLMQVEEGPREGVRLQSDTMILHVRPGSDTLQRRWVAHEWYRRQLEDAIPCIQKKWNPLVKVSPKSVTVRHMRTRWGSCTPNRATIRLNLNLAKKPPMCLEYIYVHELVHLLERSHNHLFTAHMDRLMPSWRHHRAELNRETNHE